MAISTISEPRPGTVTATAPAAIASRPSETGQPDHRRLKTDTVEISALGQAMLEKSPACPTCGSAGCAGC